MTSTPSRTVALQASPLSEFEQWIKSTQGRIPRVALIAFIAYLVWVLALPASPAHRLIVDVYVVIVPLAAAISAWVTAQRPTLDRRTRQGWLSCGVAFLAIAIGNVIRSVYYYKVGPQQMVYTANVVYLVYYPALLWGLLRFPTVQRSRADMSKLWLDVGTVAVVAGTIVWYLVLDPIVDSGSVKPLTVILLGIYPIGDLAVLFASTVLLLRDPPQLSRTAIQIVALAGVAMFCSDLTLGYTVVHHGVYETGSWTDLGWQTAMMLWLLATFQQRWCAARHTAEVGTTQEGAFTVSIIPYAAVLVGYGLLIVAVRPYWNDIGETVSGVLLLTALVITRQIIAVRENAQLLNERVGQEARFRSLVQNASDVITVVDEQGIIQFMSPAVEQVFGWLPTESLGSRITSLVHRDDAATVTDFLNALLANDGTTTPNRSLIVRCRTKNGEWRHIETIATVLMDDPIIHGIVLNTRDVSERIELQSQLSYQAYHDSLTQLANRSWFHTRVEGALKRSQDAREHVAVFFLDLDNFKNINDSLGHAEGDVILIEVARRLLNATRGSDTVARLGGDEFAVLIDRVATETDLIIIAERVTNAMRAPFVLDSGEVFSSISIGIARGGPAQTVDDLLRNADVAMYVSKRHGKGGYTLFEPRMQVQARDRLGLEIDLRHALMRDELKLFFQPIVSLADGKLLGVETLVRWEHPQRGLLFPKEFIPMAEESGLILPLGRWVLAEACRHAARWHTMLRSDAHLSISVNVSGRQLEHVAFIDEVANTLRDTGLTPSDLLLEVTESVIVRDVAVTRRQLKALKALGVRLAIDDFGTGYSSLSFLQQFPVDVLKIDKSFIHNAGTSENGLELAKTIVALGKTLSLQTVAEGIEQEQQATAFAAIGCGLAQGFYFSRPVRAAEIDALLQARSA